MKILVVYVIALFPCWLLNIKGKWLYCCSKTMGSSQNQQSRVLTPSVPFEFHENLSKFSCSKAQGQIYVICFKENTLLFFSKNKQLILPSSYNDTDKDPVTDPAAVTNGRSFLWSSIPSCTHELFLAAFQFQQHGVKSYWELHLEYLCTLSLKAGCCLQRGLEALRPYQPATGHPTGWQRNSSISWNSAQPYQIRSVPKTQTYSPLSPPLN